MTRIDTNQSEQAYQAFKNVRSIFCKEYSAFGNDLVILECVRSKSTRSFYINIGRMDGYDNFKIRVSDHMNGMRCDADMCVDFSELTEQIIIDAMIKHTRYTYNQILNAKYN